MDLGPRTRMINFEPIDAAPAPAEPAALREGGPAYDPQASRVGPVTEPVERQVEFVGAEWV